MVKLLLTAKTNKKVTEGCIDYLIFSRKPNYEYVHVDAEDIYTYRTSEGIRVEMIGLETIDGTPVTADELRKMNFVGVEIYDDYPDAELTLDDVRIESIEKE